MRKIKKLIPVGLALTPFIAFGQTGQTIDSIDSLLSRITDILFQVFPVLIGIAVVIFLVGVIRYVTVGREEEVARASARSMMIYGIIGLFVMVSVWGLVNIIGGTFNLKENPDFRNPIERIIP